MLLDALAQAGDAVTDEAGAVEALGHRPLLVPGGAQNFKVTYPDDFALAEATAKDNSDVFWCYRGRGMPKVAQGKALAAKFYEAWTQGNIRYLPLSEPLAVFKDEKGKEITLLAPLVWRGPAEHWSGGRPLAAVMAMLAVGSALPATVPVLNRTVTQLLSDRAHTQRSDRVFTSPRRVRFREMEYAVPYESVGAAFDEVRSLIAERDWRIGFPIEVRAAAADENWLSTAYGRDSAYIAVHRYVRDDPTEYFAAVEQIMRRYDGRPHWGKMHNRTAADLRDTYPRFDDFLAVREKLDPQRTFANSYLQQVLGE